MLHLPWCFCVLVGILPLPGCDRGAPPTSKVDHAVGDSKVASDAPTLTEQERAAIVELARDGEYKGKSEEEAYAVATQTSMHHLYVAFLELFPSSPHAEEIRKRLATFRQFVATNATVLTDQELKDRFNWNGEDKLYRWAQGLSGKTRDKDSGKTFWFGPLCMGNIELNGNWTFEHDGTHLLAGSRIVYPSEMPCDPRISSCP